MVAHTKNVRGAANGTKVQSLGFRILIHITSRLHSSTGFNAPVAGASPSRAPSLSDPDELELLDVELSLWHV